jgi:hypothetical protein
MSSNTPSGHCSGTNTCLKRTPGRSAHLRLASTSGFGVASIARTASQREASKRALGAFRSCVAFKKEFIWKIEMGQVDLAE